MRQRKYPDEPWMWREDWAKREIVYSDSKSAIVTLIASILLPLSTIKFVMSTLHKYGGLTYHGESLLIIIGLSVASLVSIGCCIYFMLRWFRFGISKIHLETLPIPLGGEMKAILMTNFDARILNICEVDLSCASVQLRSSGRRGAGSYEEVTLLWTQIKTLTAEDLVTEMGRTGIPIQFEIPASQSSTHIKGFSSAIVWILKVKLDLPGVDYKAEFVLPVFSDPNAQIKPTADHPTVGF
jgi:hypothetical protein